MERLFEWLFHVHEWGPWQLSTAEYDNVFGYKSGPVEVRYRRCKSCLKADIRRLGR